jgi:hypothetical protein
MVECRRHPVGLPQGLLLDPPRVTEGYKARTSGTERRLIRPDSGRTQAPWVRWDLRPIFWTGSIYVLLLGRVGWRALFLVASPRRCVSPVWPSSLLCCSHPRSSQDSTTTDPSAPCPRCCLTSSGWVSAFISGRSSADCGTNGVLPSANPHHRGSPGPRSRSCRRTRIDLGFEWRR